MSNINDVNELKLFTPWFSWELIVKKYLHEVVWKINIYKTLSLIKDLYFIVSMTNEPNELQGSRAIFLILTFSITFLFLIFIDIFVFILIGIDIYLRYSHHYFVLQNQFTLNNKHLPKTYMMQSFDHKDRDP